MNASIASYFLLLHGHHLADSDTFFLCVYVSVCVCLHTGMRKHGCGAPVCDAMWCDYWFGDFDIRGAKKTKNRKDRHCSVTNWEGNSPNLEPTPPPLQTPPAGKDTALEWHSPDKSAYIYGDWLAGRKLMKCDISHNSAVQKSCRVTVKCQHSVNKTNLKWKMKSVNYFCTVLNIQTETGFIVDSDLHLHFTAMPVLPLLVLSFSKLCIIKAQTTKPTVRKYWQTINP